MFVDELRILKYIWICKEAGDVVLYVRNIRKRKDSGVAAFNGL